LPPKKRNLWVNRPQQRFVDSLGHFRYHENRMPLHARYSLGRADLAAITANISDHLAALNKGFTP
jgi:hypothetical protein